MAPKRGMPAVAYLRVSTEKQADRGNSLPAQKKAIEAYANLYGLRIVAWVRDPEQSAKSLNRPGIQKALAMLSDGEAEALVVAKLDRLTRSIRDLGALLDGYFREHALLSVGEQVDTRTATGRMVLNVIATIAQWEREQIGERVATMHAEKRARGERIGKPSYGYRVARDGVHLERQPAEQRAIKKMKRLQSSGSSIREIAATLEADGAPKRGKRWHPTTVARILRRDA